MTDLDFEMFEQSVEEEIDLDEQIAAFEARVTKQIRILNSRKPSTARRIKAAQWLGESGSPQAIESLVRIYESPDEDKALRQAAKYALGQFKALHEAIDVESGESIDDALAREENAIVMDLLSDIAVNGRMGRRKRIPPRHLHFAQIGLAVSLMVLIGLNIVVAGGRGSDGLDVVLLNSPPPTHAPGISEETSQALDSLAVLRTRLSNLVADNLMLQGDLMAAASGSLNCRLNFFRPSPYMPPPAVDSSHPNLSVISNRLTTQINELNVVHLVRDDACNTGIAPSAAQLEIQNERLDTIYDALPGILQAIITAENNLNVGVPTAAPEATEEPAEETPELPTETPIPEPTLDPTTVNSHLLALVNIVDNLNAQRGANTLLEQYWNDIQRGGSTDGCRMPPPAIPDDYTVPQEMLDQELLLADSLARVNLALALLRDAWASFQSGCFEDNLVEVMTPSLARLEAVDVALEGALDSIRTLQMDLRQR